MHLAYAFTVQDGVSSGSERVYANVESESFTLHKSGGFAETKGLLCKLFRCNILQD